jgi:hypothetical protein
VARCGLRTPARSGRCRGDDPAAVQAAQALAHELLLVLRRPRGAARRGSRTLARPQHRLDRERSSAYAETIGEATLNLFDCWLDPELFDTRFEFAVRSWALQSEEVAAEIKAADQQRLEAITAMFTRFGYPLAEADARARTVYLTQIGYISMQTVEAPEVRMPRVAHYVEIFTGKPAQPRELARFFARHHYS